MKKIITLLVIVIAANTTFSQDCTKTLKKDKFELVDGLIKATLYHDNGLVAQTGYYTEENKLQGEWISYNSQGIKTAEAFYNDGVKIGTWFFYDGDTKKEVTYENAKIAEVKTWVVSNTQVVTN